MNLTEAMKETINNIVLETDDLDYDLRAAFGLPAEQAAHDGCEDINESKHD
jgi:hypothetical protein